MAAVRSSENQVVLEVRRPYVSGSSASLLANRPKKMKKANLIAEQIRNAGKNAGKLKSQIAFLFSCVP